METKKVRRSITINITTSKTLARTLYFFSRKIRKLILFNSGSIAASATMPRTTLTRPRAHQVASEIPRALNAWAPSTTCFICSTGPLMTRCASCLNDLTTSGKISRWGTVLRIDSPSFEANLDFFQCRRYVSPADKVSSSPVACFTNEMHVYFMRSDNLLHEIWWDQGKKRWRHATISKRAMVTTDINSLYVSGFYHIRQV